MESYLAPELGDEIVQPESTFRFYQVQSRRMGGAVRIPGQLHERSLAVLTIGFIQVNQGRRDIPTGKGQPCEACPELVEGGERE
jgi:hypothetical protein